MFSIESKLFSERMRAAVSLSWVIFSKKVGNHLIKINKEASMQLLYAQVLQQFLPLITFQENEKYEIELETGVKVSDNTREIDILFSGEFNGKKHKTAIELKCYRTYASSGGKRGATDIFMKDVYYDLYLLEEYVSNEIATEGVALVMNELEGLIFSEEKDAKCWDYDISNDQKVNPKMFNTPIGGKDISFQLKKEYVFDWTKCGDFWFAELEGSNPLKIP